MRWIYLIFSLVATILLVIALDSQWTLGNSLLPRLGFLLSPQKGFWQNAEPVNTVYDLSFKSDQLQGKVDVYFDERLVPHVYAENQNDAYFVQGYLHAKFRLWQMEFQTHVAAGRLSEIMGEKADGKNFLKIDKYFRRLGMVYAAENSLKAMENDSTTKMQCDNYTAGANAYINTLTEEKYPLEYKLLNYKPEPWTNLKTALLLKYLSYDLAGYEQDFENTAARSVLTKDIFEKLYPYGQDSVDPIIPKGTDYSKIGLHIQAPQNADSAYFIFKTTSAPDTTLKPNPANGSNNWAVSGTKTKSGKPILCNDPHLSLNLPSLWYEIQLSTPNNNVYGVSLPGAPSVIIGFNDSCAFGCTNAMRDVRDYYEIKFQDSSKTAYWFNGQWQKTNFREEIIKIKGKPNHIERIAMTVWGPVMYDEVYPNPLQNGKAYACRWKAHDASNELKTFTLLNHALNIGDYLGAITSYKCPGQNMIFATASGDIAIKQQGEFPAKWKRQGDFVMQGTDSSYAWKNMIPDEDNFVLYNPVRGFVSSANQYPFDISYPYYMGGYYPPYRGIIINRKLSSMHNITTDDMEQMQTNNYNVLAEMAKPVLLKNIEEPSLTKTEKEYLDIFKQWNLCDDADEKGPIIFNCWWDSLMNCIYKDELNQLEFALKMPEKSTLLEGVLKDSLYRFADDITTDKKETVKDMVLRSFKQAVAHIAETNIATWAAYKDSEINHLLQLSPFSRRHIHAGGSRTVINAFAKTHGPSWRMVVELTSDINAYGAYPGGQDGNPGSKYYDNFVDTWTQGKYYKIKIRKKENGKNLTGKIIFDKK